MNRPTNRIVAFGEPLLRLSPTNREPLLQGRTLDVHVGGAEVNVASQLARLGHAAAMVSALPEGPLGDAVITHLRGYGVNTDAVVRCRGRMGLYFVSSGAGVRATTVLYDRAGSAFCGAAEDTWDWDKILGGARLFHVSGITPALGKHALDAIEAALNAATRLGVAVSFDGNYREHLWKASGLDPATCLPPLVEQAEILIGNHRDIALLTGLTLTGVMPDDRRAAALAAFDRFPRLMLVAGTVRTVATTGIHSFAGRVDTRDGWYETAAIELSGVVDRIGSGDAFAAGILHGVVMGKSVDRVALIGQALGALKHTVPGDGSLFTAADLDALLGGQFDIMR